MPVFGNQVSILVYDFFNIFDIFSRSEENFLVKDIGIRIDFLVNKFGFSSEGPTTEPSNLFAVVEIACPLRMIT